jgi:glycerol-3-phosphate dehydrogenase
MQRDPAALTTHTFDVLIVGGGSHGLFAAYDAALRGLRVAVIDRGDLGGGLSANHQRTIHGGLRAMQSGDLAKASAQIRERRTWARIAPALIRPLPFLFGTYKTFKRSRLAVRVGFAAYDFLGRHRNDGVTGELHLPKGRLESAAVTKRLFPGIAAAGLTGGAMWYDYQTTQAERLTWCIAMAADAAGATLVNYVEAIGPRPNGAAGIAARDVLSGATLEISAAVVIFSAAEGLAALHDAFGLTGAPPLLGTMNLLIDRPSMDMAHVAAASTGRMLTAVPWRGNILVGTSQTDHAVAPGTRVTEAEIAAFLAEANSAFPYLKATRADVRLVHHGLVPAAPGKRGLDLPRDFEVRSHQDQSKPSLISLIGAKYTTARLAAEHAIDAACRQLGKTGAHSRTADRALPHAGIADVEGHLIETARDTGGPLDTETLRHLAAWYGTEAPAVLTYARASQWKDTRVVASAPVLAAEVAYARDHAMAMTADDVIYRRTALGGAGRVTGETIAKVESLIANR